MEMVWHNDEFMEEVSTPAIMVESLNQQLRPAFITKQRTSSPSLGGNEVGLLVMGGMLSRGSQRRTSGAKAPLFRSRTARLKARPFKHPSLPYSAPEGAPFQTSFAPVRRVYRRAFSKHSNIRAAGTAEAGRDPTRYSLLPFHSS